MHKVNSLNRDRPTVGQRGAIPTPKIKTSVCVYIYIYICDNCVCAWDQWLFECTRFGSTINAEFWVCIILFVEADRWNIHERHYLIEINVRQWL